jgi:copper(I)-binding protein
MSSQSHHSTIYLANVPDRIVKNMNWKLVLPLLALVCLVGVACGSSEQITVTDLWGRPSPGSAANAAFYVSIHNNGSALEELVAADIDICGQTELHESTIDENSVMRMQHVEIIRVPPGETIHLEPGGYHIMCIDRQADLDPGDQIPITLHFANYGELSVEAEIREQ